MLTFNSLMLATTGVTQPISTSGFYIEYLLGYSVQTTFSGNWDGTVSLNSSNDGVNYTPITGASKAISTSGSVMFNVWQARYQYTQAQFTPGVNPSSGVLSFRIQAKEF